MKARALAWLRKALSEGDGAPSMKRLVFAVAVAAAIALCLGDFAIQRGLSNNAVQLMTIVVTSAAGAYFGGRWCETKEQ